MIAANAGWLLSFDNLSNIPVWLQTRSVASPRAAVSPLAKLIATTTSGSSMPSDQSSLPGSARSPLKRPSRPATILITLPAIKPAGRVDEHAFWDKVDAVHANVLGALCDALSGALANIATTSLDDLPRMADMALWVSAAEPSLGWTPGAFIGAYGDNREKKETRSAIAASPIGNHLRTLAQQGFHGTPSQLLAALNRLIDDADKPDGWPSQASQVGSEVRRLAPNLRALGYQVDNGRTKRNGAGSPSASRKAGAVTAVTAVTNQPAAATPDAPSHDVASTTSVEPSPRSRGARLTRILRRQPAAPERS